ncbi:hypothetical protein JHK87_042669 [Glycine soja]|nr:hypothetical protein JHK87_042669 [Glycine soja]
MEQCHEEELIRLQADHDQLEARVRHPQGDEQSARTLPECTQGESHPQRIGYTAEDLSLPHMHHAAAWTVNLHSFVNHIMEADIPLGWKPLNLKQYDGTTDLGAQLSRSRISILSQVSLDREFERDDTSDRGAKPIKELIQLQLGPKLGQCMRLSRDLFSHEHRASLTCYAKTQIYLSGNHLTCRESSPT